MVTAKHTTQKLALALVAATLLTLTAATGAHAATAPVKEVVTGHIGWEVNETTKTNLCTVESGDLCQPGLFTGEPGGFTYPEGIAVNNDPDPLNTDYHNIYVAEPVNARVQELTPNGVFVRMFGKNVNKTKEKESAPQAERDICTAASLDICQAGIEGSDSGEFSGLASIAIDPGTGNVDVQDVFNWRVQEFTSTGKFVLMIGRKVNKTTRGNVCTQKEIETEGVKCQGGERGPEGTTEAGAFDFSRGQELAVGGPRDLLYVGDEHRVQEFDREGQPQQEVSLSQISSEPFARVSAITVDQAGSVYLVYSHAGQANEIREFDQANKEVKTFTVSPTATVVGIAVNLSGRIAVTGFDEENQSVRRFGLLYTAETGHLITEFFAGTGSRPAFNDQDELYTSVTPGEGTGHEIIRYKPRPVMELSTLPETCQAGPRVGSSATFSCPLEGTVDPEEVDQTEVWFQYGPTCSFGTETSKQPIATGLGSVPVLAVMIEHLRPNSVVCYGLAGYDRNVKAPEGPVTSETTTLRTPAVAPVIVGEPSASFIGSSSAVLFAELNPENTSTAYFFEYGTCGGLSSASSKTGVLSSSAYGTIGATLEVEGLQPETVYCYRLHAENESKQVATPAKEGAFTTAAVPMPQAETGGVSTIGTNSAVISGTVNPDGQAAVYTFEVGIYNETNTQYGTVISGSTGAGTMPITKSFALTGLQPGTKYAYQIKIKSGYGIATGVQETFTTAGLPSILSVPTPPLMLAIPRIKFPTQSLLPKPAKKLKHKPKQRKPKRKRNAAIKTHKTTHQRGRTSA